jgi:hypothetical protein
MSWRRCLVMRGWSSEVPLVSLETDVVNKLTNDDVMLQGRFQKLVQLNILHGHDI